MYRSFPLCTNNDLVSMDPPIQAEYIVLENFLYTPHSSKDGESGLAKEGNLSTNPPPDRECREVQNALYSLGSLTDEESGDDKQEGKMHSNPSNKGYEEIKLIHGHDQA